MDSHSWDRARCVRKPKGEGCFSGRSFQTHLDPSGTPGTLSAHPDDFSLNYSTAVILITVKAWERLFADP